MLSIYSVQTEFGRRQRIRTDDLGHGVCLPAVRFNCHWVTASVYQLYVLIATGSNPSTRQKETVVITV